MVRNFKEMSKMNEYINNKIKLSLISVGNVVIQELKKNVLESVYILPPVKYRRTYQVLDSITSTEPVNENGKWVVKIFFDPLKIQVIIRENEWNAHADFSGNWVMSNPLPAHNLIGWLENGTPNNPYYNHEAHHFFKDTIEWLEKEYVSMFKAHLKKNGIPL